jgi:predicted transcriptional regulator
VLIKQIIHHGAQRITAEYNPCYTLGMKTAVSLPDELFRLAERTARKLKMSRSQLYATAISEFIDRRQARKITERLNEIYSEESAKLDSALHRAQIKSLAKESW